MRSESPYLYVTPLDERMRTLCLFFFMPAPLLLSSASTSLPEDFDSVLYTDDMVIVAVMIIFGSRICRRRRRNQGWFSSQWLLPRSQGKERQNEWPEKKFEGRLRPTCVIRLILARRGRRSWAVSTRRAMETPRAPQMTPKSCRLLTEPVAQ